MGALQKTSVEAIARVLAQASGFNYGGLVPYMKRSFQDSAAAVLDAGYLHTAELEAVKAAALEAAATAMDEAINRGDLAEVAAVGADWGRSEAMADRYTLYDEPSEWLRRYAHRKTTESETNHV